MSKYHKEIISCNRCLNQQPFVIWDSVNPSVDPELKQKLINGELTEFVCEKCNNKLHVEFDCLYHDMGISLLIWLKYSDPNGSFRNESILKFPFNTNYTYRIVNSFNDLIDKILIFDDGFSDHDIELIKLLICMRESTDISRPFYYAGTKFVRRKGKMLVFILETDKGLIEKYYEMEKCLNLIEPLKPKISSILDSMSDQWLKVDRASMLQVLEEARLIQGKSKSLNYVRVHILDILRGSDLTGIDDLDDLSQLLEDITQQDLYRVENWVIGKDLTNEQVEKWKDPTTGDIYIIIHYKEGKPETYAVSKTIWEQHKTNLENI